MGEELRIDPALVRLLAADLDGASPALTSARRQARGRFGPDGVPTALADCADAYARAFALVPAAIEAMEVSAGDIADGLRSVARTVQEADDVAGRQIGEAGSSP